MRVVGGLVRGCGRSRLLCEDCRLLANWTSPCGLPQLAGVSSTRGTARGEEYSHGSTLCARRGRMEASARSQGLRDLEME